MKCPPHDTIMITTQECSIHVRDYRTHGRHLKILIPFLCLLLSLRVTTFQGQDLRKELLVQERRDREKGVRALTVFPAMVLLKGSQYQC